MKYCQNCGAENLDNSRVCAKCGVLLYEAKPKEETEQPAAAPAAPKVPVYQAPPIYQKVENGDEEPISMGKWFLYHLIPMIPGVGYLVYVVMMCIWAFGGTERNTTFRNWARVQLIFLGIGLVLAIVMVVLLVALISAGLANGEFTSGTDFGDYSGY